MPHCTDPEFFLHRQGDNVQLGFPVDHGHAVDAALASRGELVKSMEKPEMMDTSSLHCYLPQSLPTIDSVDGNWMSQNRRHSFFQGYFKSDCSSGFDGDERVRGSEETEAKNRKKKRRDDFIDFMESLAKRVKDMQEEFQKKMMEALDKRERERMVREETWRHQGMLRAQRDDALRAQVISRNLEIISFLENLTNRSAEFPRISPSASPVDDEAGRDDDEDDAEEDDHDFLTALPK